MGTGIIAIAAGIAMGCAALGIGIGQGMLGSKAMESMGKQPEAAGSVISVSLFPVRQTIKPVS